MNLYPIRSFKSVVLLLLIFSLSLNCKKDQPVEEMEVPFDYGYQAEIISPSPDTFLAIGDTLPLAIDFISATNEIVHNIRVEIHRKNQMSDQLYKVQSHVHQPVKFEYRDQVHLKGDATEDDAGDWLILASVWSHYPEDPVTTDTVEFHILRYR